VNGWRIQNSHTTTVTANVGLDSFGSILTLYTFRLMNVVTLRYAPLVPRWVTVFGQVNHLGTEPGTQAYSAWACPLCRLEWVPGEIAWHNSPCTWFRSVRWLSGWWLASRDQRRLPGSGSALETCSWRCSIQMAAFTLLYFDFTALMTARPTYRW